MRFSVHPQGPLSVAVPELRLPELRLPEFSINWSLFLDVDGTLLDLAAHPDAVSVDTQPLHLVKDQRTALGSAFALITGRSVAKIDDLFTPEKLSVAGSAWRGTTRCRRPVAHAYRWTRGAAQRRDPIAPPDRKGLGPVD